MSAPYKVRAARVYLSHLKPALHQANRENEYSVTHLSRSVTLVHSCTSGRYPPPRDDLLHEWLQVGEDAIPELKKAKMRVHRLGQLSLKLDFFPRLRLVKLRHEVKARRLEDLARGVQLVLRRFQRSRRSGSTHPPLNPPPQL